VRFAYYEMLSFVIFDTRVICVQCMLSINVPLWRVCQNILKRIFKIMNVNQLSKLKFIIFWWILIIRVIFNLPDKIVIFCGHLAVNNLLKVNFCLTDHLRIHRNCNRGFGLLAERVGIYTCSLRMVILYFGRRFFPIGQVTDISKTDNIFSLNLLTQLIGIKLHRPIPFKLRLGKHLIELQMDGLGFLIQECFEFDTHVFTRHPIAHHGRALTVLIKLGVFVIEKFFFDDNEISLFWQKPQSSHSFQFVYFRNNRLLCFQRVNPKFNEKVQIL